MKTTLTTITNAQNVSAINDNFSKVQDALNNGTLWRDNPVGEANQMDNVIDMNGFDILNAKTVHADDVEVDGISLIDQVEAAAASAAASAQSASDSAASAALAAANAAKTDPDTNPLAPSLDGSETFTIKKAGSWYKTTLTNAATWIATVATLFTQVGVGATARTLVAKLFDLPLTPQDYGAVGGGVTDDTVAIQKAVTAANLVGKTLHWPATTYLTAASITNLHSVRHTGNGVISRNGVLFPVVQADSTSNQLFVDTTTGSDTNDGLSSSFPTKTIQAAVNYATKYRPLNGSWTISIAAGTYNEAVNVPGWLNPNSNWLTIKGPTQATVQTQPTVTINNPGGLLYGMNCNQGNAVRIRDIMFTGWMSGAGVFFDNHCYAWTTNVWVLQCLQGIATAGSETLIEGGRLTGITWTSGGAMPAGGGAVGVYNYSNGVVTIGYNSTSSANGTILENFSQAAYEGKTNTHCVSLNSTYQNNVLATWVYTNSRFDDKANNFRKNQAVHRLLMSMLSKDLVLTSSYHFDEAFNFDPSVTAFGNNGNGEVYQFYQFSCEDATLHAKAISGLDICHQRQSTLQTGPIASNTLIRNLCTIYPGMLTNSTNGKYMEVYLNGNTAGAGGSKTVTVNLGATALAALTIASGTIQWFAKITIWANNSTSQIVLIEASNAVPSAARFSTVTDMTVNQVLNVTGTVPSSGDTSTLNEARVVMWG